MSAIDEHNVDILEPPFYIPGGKTQGIVQAIRSGDWMHTTDVWLYRDYPELQILFQQRDLASPTYAGKLDCSVAGYLMAGETGKKGGVREVAEEFGVNLKEDDLTMVGRRFNAMLDHRGRERRIVANKHIVRWNFELDTLKLNPEEVRAVFWVPAVSMKDIEDGSSVEVYGIDSKGKKISKLISKSDFAYNLDDYYFRIAEQIQLIEQKL